MTKEEKNKLDAFFEERLKHEIKYLKENDAEVNEYGAYVYTSKNGSHSLRLDLFLRDFRDWLIENGIVKSNDI
jgi:hypothetical protein